MGGSDEDRFVVVDVETTGLQPRTERIIEIAIALMDPSGWVIDEWASLIRPDDRELTGRLTALEDAPVFRDVAGEICHRLSQGVVSGHNVLFDLRFIDAELRRMGARLPGLDYLDTHAVATALSVDTPNRSLAVLCHAMEIPFTQWHTAEGDVAATAKLLTRLLERARGWGQESHEPYLRVWDAPGEVFPALERSDSARRRDLDLFPPGGKQPTAASVFRPSWRRAGSGPSQAGDGAVSVTIGIDDTKSKQMLIEAATRNILEWPAPEWPGNWSDDMRLAADVVKAGSSDAQEAAWLFMVCVLERRRAERTPADEAASDFAGGDFRGLEGIAELERIISVLSDDGGHDDTLARAWATLADLYRRHGGRNDDVVDAYRHGFDAASRACLTTEPRWEPFDYDDTEAIPEDPERRGFWDDEAAEALDDVITGWWGYHETRRESTAMAELFDLLHTPGLRLRYVSGSELAGTAIENAVRRGELVMAAAVLDAVVAVMSPDDQRTPICAALERLANAHAVQGTSDEAIAWCERAWAGGWADQRVANRHSLILERAHRWADAAEVASRGCALPSSEYADGLAKRVLRCGKKAGATA